MLLSLMLLDSGGIGVRKVFSRSSLGFVDRKDLAASLGSDCW